MKINIDMDGKDNEVPIEHIQEQTIEFKTNDKVKALELLGRHLGIFNDKIDVNVKEKEEKKNAISDILNQMQSADDV